jgi:hypothetical protein
MEIKVKKEFKEFKEKTAETEKMELMVDKAPEVNHKKLFFYINISKKGP